MNKLPIEFYKRSNVVLIARELLGKIIVTNIDGIQTSGRIVETEAYAGITDKASHAYAGKRTGRNEHMYGEAANAYVYICYGIHQMFNIVTNDKEIPDAILIRAIDPLEGIEYMLVRTEKKKADHTLTRGPGNVGKALGIFKLHSGINITGDTIFLAEDDFKPEEDMISCSKRIGVNYAGPDALLPYRFYLKGNKFVSGSPK